MPHSTSASKVSFNGPPASRSSKTKTSQDVIIDLGNKSSSSSSHRHSHRHRCLPATLTKHLDVLELPLPAQARRWRRRRLLPMGGGGHDSDDSDDSDEEEDEEEVIDDAQVLGIHGAIESERDDSSKGRDGSRRRRRRRRLRIVQRSSIPFTAAAAAASTSSPSSSSTSTLPSSLSSDKAAIASHVLAAAAACDDPISTPGSQPAAIAAVTNPPPTTGSKAGTGSAATSTTSTNTTGTTLWLGAQVMAAYLSEILPAKVKRQRNHLHPHHRRARSAGKGARAMAKPILELGGGVGYLALVLASLGLPNDIITTDIEPALSLVLAPNIARNQPSSSSSSSLRDRGQEGGWVDVRPLDWMGPRGSSREWLGVGEEGVDAGPNDGLSEAASTSSSMTSSTSPSPRALPDSTAKATSSARAKTDRRVVGNLRAANGTSSSSTRPACGEFECLVTTDTVYAPSLVDPLLRTLRWLSLPSSQALTAATAEKGRPSRGGGGGRGAAARRRRGRPDVYVAIEGRDPTLVTHAVERARSFGFKCTRIDQARVDRCVVDAGWGWSMEADDDADDQDDRLDDHVVRREDWDGIEIWKWKLGDDVDDVDDDL